ncbi:Adaptor protein complex 4, subunit epsilon, partial [Emiliania huxleyi CCMP1516]|uniref:Clathrin/coatomer adaptor adaptin-like N-terminal domain-containing protein n=2 Tax=Emiliania huxleyi TaxID=2903 RepID=A0A0D3JX67_EMIH1
MSGGHLSKDFFELIKSIGECKSKQEEDKILAAEVATLRQRFTEQLSPKKMKEAVVRMMYAEMLGHNADFGHIHAVNMSQQTNLIAKRVGYLASTVCLHSGFSLPYLPHISPISPLKSTSHVEVCATLVAIPKLVNLETLPALMDPVCALLDHPSEVVRKKAVMALHRFCQLQPSSAADLSEKLRRVLCDKDPAVMGASLYILHEGAEADPKAHKDLVPSYVSILKQITEHRLPSSFDYHRTPAPWIQIKLLKLMATLGTADQRASEGMYEVLLDVLRRADTGINIGYAIIYEAVRTITAIFPNIQLLETAASHISRFVSSDNHNLKYLGIKALAGVVQVNQKYALEHQLVVVDCLEDPDETLKRKTLDLLYRMTNAGNVVFVVDKLISHLRETSDDAFRASLTERITQLAERYAPDNSWFIRTMNGVRLRARRRARAAGRGPQLDAADCRGVRRGRRGGHGAPPLRRNDLLLDARPADPPRHPRLRHLLGARGVRLPHWRRSGARAGDV